MTRPHQQGYSLVILMGSITFMLIAMGVAAPTWQHVMQDDREQELFFRGSQIAEAIQRFSKKNANALPTSIDVLVKGRFLRRAYQDPMTRDGKWRLIRQGEGLRLPNVTPPGGAGTRPTPPTTMPQERQGSPGALGPFVGVASLSPKKSIRVMNNAKTYDTWLFIAGQPRFFGKQPPVGIINPGAPGTPGPPRPSPTALTQP